MPENEEARRARTREYMAQYIAETRQWRIERQRCIECGKKDAYTLGGRRYCYDCAQEKKERARKYYAEHADEQNAAAKIKRDYRRNAGLCTACGGNRPAGYYPYLLCPACRAKTREDKKKKSREQGVITRTMYAELGMCHLCGKPVADGVTAYGEPLLLCAICYEKLKKAGEKGREAYKEKYGKTCGQSRSEYEFGRKKAADTEVR